MNFFLYRPGNSFLHRTNPALKVILLLVLATSAFFVPAKAAGISILFILIFSLTVLHFSVRDVLYDLLPAFFYAVFFLLFSVILNLVENGLPQSVNLQDIEQLLKPQMQYVTLAVRLTLSLSLSSVFYRTTSTPQFTEGFRSIEHALTKKDSTPFADSLSLTLTFIPQIAQFWHRISCAWNARNGRKNIRRITTLVPVLFRISMEEAYRKTLAMQNRT